MPRRGTYPEGAYVNSTDATVAFFTEPKQLACNEALTNQMPFLYQLLVANLQADETPSADPDNGDKAPSATEEEAMHDIINLDSNPPAETPLNGNSSAPDVPVVIPPITGSNQPSENDVCPPQAPSDHFSISEADINDIHEGGFYRKSTDRQVRRQVRVETVIPLNLLPL
jgi:hypothetical protein